MNQQCGLVSLNNPSGALRKQKQWAAGKMQTDKKIFDPKYSSTITSYSQGGQMK
jgi:hypothetical protein